VKEVDGLAVRLPAQVFQAGDEGAMPMPPPIQICRGCSLRKSKQPYGPSTVTVSPMCRRAGSERV
jgi:hypothetical protein